MSGRFDAEVGKPYGQCSTCEFTAQTDEDSTRHLMESMGTSDHSHSMRVTNQTRFQRINSWIGDVERNAVDDAVDEIYDAVQDGDLTSEEALKAWYRNDLVRDEVEEALS